MGITSIKYKRKVEKHEVISKYRPLIDAVRRVCISDKSVLANFAQLSWPTVGKSIPVLLDKGVIIENTQKTGYEIVKEYGYFMGISIGANECKVAIIDMGFNILTNEIKNKWNALYQALTKNSIKTAIEESSNPNFISHTTPFCYKTPDYTDQIASLIREKINIILEYDRSLEDFDLLGIGVAFPGIIDLDNKIIKKCPNIPCLMDTKLTSLISAETISLINNQGVIFALEHDTQASTIYELNHYYLEQGVNAEHVDNFACVYMGTGVGLGLYINGKLLRGLSFSAGEIGHIKSPEITIEKTENFQDNFDRDYYLIDENIPETLEDANKLIEGKEISEISEHIQKSISIEESTCALCGRKNCLETNLRRKVFNSTSKDDYAIKTKNKYLIDFKKNHPYRFALLREYIGYIVNLLVNFLNVEIIVFSGRILNNITDLIDDYPSFIAAYAMGIPAGDCKIIKGGQIAESVAAGVAMVAYMGSGTEDNTIFILK